MNIKRKLITIYFVILLWSSSFAIGLIDIDSTQSKTPFSPQIHESLDYIINKETKNETWNKTYGGTNIDIGHSVRQTTDGGYVITGYTRSYGTSGRNVWLIKTDRNGNEEWNKTFGGNDDDEGRSVQQTNDGGYIITGYSKSYSDGNQDVICIKTDMNGNQEWMKIFGGGEDDVGTDIQQTNDEGYIIAGYTWSFSVGGADVWLIKLDDSGNQEWSKNHGGLSSDGAWSIQQTIDNGYIITGWTFSQGPGYLGNVWLLKTDDEGNEEWNQVFGGTEADRGYSVRQTNDGGYIITGYTESYGAGLTDVLLLKTNDSGNQLWQQTFGGTGRDYGNAVQQTNDGGYVITGYTLSYGAGSDDLWLIKTDENGDHQFDETYGGASSDVGYDIQQTSDGGYIIVGHTLSYGAGVHDVWLIKTAANNITSSISLDEGWNFLSLPFNQSIDKNTIVVDYNQTAYSWSEAVSMNIINGFIFGWNRTGQHYAFENILQPGYGYWLFAYQKSTMRMENITPSVDKYVTKTEPGWNMLGIPYDEPVSKITLKVNNVNWTTAVDNNWINEYLFGWNRTGQHYDFNEIFMPGYCYWLYASITCVLKRNTISFV